MRSASVSQKRIPTREETIGVTKFNSLTELALLEHCLRQDLNKVAKRAMAVFDPLEVEIENWEEGKVDMLEAVNNPENPDAGTRKVTFGREIFIEQDDFMETPPPKYYRLAPGQEVRLRWAYIIKCTDVIKNADGSIKEIHCTYDPETKGGNPTDGRKIKGTIHWVNAADSISAEVRLYDRLFTKEFPEDVEEGHDFIESINPASCEIIRDCRLEPALATLPPETRVQFERLGYFCTDRYDHKPGTPVFNRTVGLKDSWAKIEKKADNAAKPAAKPAPAEKAPENVALIDIADFAKLQLVTAKILEAEAIPNTDKLLKLKVNCGGERQIVAGIAKFYKPEELPGKTIVIVKNLQPATLCGVESFGMLLAAKRKKELRLLTVDGDIPEGTPIG